MFRLIRTALFPAVLTAAFCVGAASAQAPDKDSSFIDADGTAHVTRVVPVPLSLSPEARRGLSVQRPDTPTTVSLEDRRKNAAASQATARERFLKLYPARISDDTIAGVPVHIIQPDSATPDRSSWLLINLHGGGYNTEDGSMSETISVAGLTHATVVAVLYRLAPENPFPAGVDDAIAVYKAELKTHSPRHIAIFGTSAGGGLTGEVAVKLKALHLPMPAALGIFAGSGDFSRTGDSAALFSISGLSGHLDPPVAPGTRPNAYAGNTKLDDPMLSPVFADLSGMPPTLFITSGRDMAMSGTTNLHRKFLAAGNDAELVVFEGLTHAFWNNSTLPEGREANTIMANFFAKHLK